MSKSTKMILVEDDPCMRELISHYFNSKGYDITAFSDAETAVNALSERKNGFDIVVSDQCLPNMTGTELCQSLREIGNAPPVIIVTGQQDSSFQLEAAKSGVYSTLIKPFKLASLKSLVDEATDIIENEASLYNTNYPDSIIGQSAIFLHTMEFAKRVANSQSHVLILGESGTGKEVVAQAIHQYSSRRNKPFIAVNCSAIPENLIESELFGYNKGAFTGAVEKRVGLFEAAKDGTLFLDEIGDLNFNLQAKILRVLQERTIKRIGENESRKINCRIVSATHKNLKKEVLQGRFREDLYYRLNVIPIRLAKLSERKEDIIPLADYFLKKYTAINDIKLDGFTEEAYRALTERHWPGNVRELENLIERSVVLCNSKVIDAHDLIFDSPDNETDLSSGFEKPTPVESDNNIFMVSDSEIISIDDLNSRYIQYALKKNNGLKVKTAEQLGIDRKTLSRKLNDDHVVLVKTH